MRYLEEHLWDTLKRNKMVFLGGPRQVGKTTLAKSFLKNEKSLGYLSYDYPLMRKQIVSGIIPANEKILIYDEIHKYARWRNLIKGIYDVHKNEAKIIVTGSARLDYYRKGGDSLLGRYEYYRLHPFTIGEFDGSVKDLLNFSGFPEPLFLGSEKVWRKWQRERVAKIIHEDINSLEKVKEISLMDLLMEALPSKIGSPLSIASLREDLQLGHETVSRWIDIFDRMYLTFRISPYGAPRIRAVKKEQKIYFWDWSFCNEVGPRFENFVASHLLKYCHFLEDVEGHAMELRFLRDTDKREVDFVVMKNKKPIFAVECKSGEKSLSPHVKYFKERTDIPAFYQVHLGKAHFGNQNTTGMVLPFARFVKEVLSPVSL